jgi:hypothetical protein
LWKNLLVTNNLSYLSKANPDQKDNKQYKVALSEKFAVLTDLEK